MFLGSFFISHIRFWGEPIEDKLFGKERAAHYMPVGSAVNHGMRLSLHADTPMTDPSALGLMQTAITRKTNNGRTIGVGECIDVVSAIRAVTIDAAYQLFMEDKIGSISPGKYADFVLLDKNPLDVPPDDLHAIRVCETWIAGKRAYQSESL